MKFKKLGEILINSGLITSEQCDQALKVKQANPSLYLGKILCDFGFINSSDLNNILDYHHKREKFGEILLRKNLISRVNLDAALLVSREESIPLGKTLIKMRLINEEDVAKAVAEQFDMEYVDVSKLNLPPAVSSIIKAAYARKHKMVPIGVSENTLTLAVPFPLSPVDVSQLESHIKRKIKQVVCSEGSINLAHYRLYPSIPSDSLIASLDVFEEGDQTLAKSKYLEDFVSADAEFLVKRIISIGIKERASDIHLENTEGGMIVRYRIDGALQRVELGVASEQINVSCRQIISRLKILCDLDIAEKRRPQDGSFKFKISTGGHLRTIDFRLSTVPTVYGENAVIRILDKRGQDVKLESLGYSVKHLNEIRVALAKPTGVFLVTGPTGSGKTSALYAILSHLNTPDTKTLTVEDPIEFSIDGILQTEVHEAIGNSFAKILRAFLRHDPDNIMIGEIRDSETAQIAMRAAMTGHSVLSTLHTNDATSAITRLNDMGVDKNLISSTLRMVIAQRLVRKICTKCREEYMPEVSVMNEFVFPVDHAFTFYKGRGCPNCNYSGYSGRLPIIEMWIPTKEELMFVNKDHDNISLRSLVFDSEKRSTLVEDGVMRVIAGETTLEEILRTVPYEQIESARNNLNFHYTEN